MYGQTAGTRAGGKNLRHRSGIHLWGGTDDHGRHQAPEAVSYTHLDVYKRQLYIDTAKPVKKSEKEEFPMLIAAGKRICESGWGEEELYGSHPLEFAETEITLVPYAYWGNRENGEMAVWLKEYLSDRNNK